MLKSPVEKSNLPISTFYIHTHLRHLTKTENTYFLSESESGINEAHAEDINLRVPFGLKQYERTSYSSQNTNAYDSL